MSEDQGFEETPVEEILVVEEVPEDEEAAQPFEEDDNGGDDESTDEGDPAVMDHSPAEETADDHSEDAE